MRVFRVLAVLVVMSLSVACSAGRARAGGGMAAYNQYTGAMVTAARYEPRGSILRVTNPQNGRTITVLVNDRGPFNGNRVLDLSTGAFRALYGSLRRGVGLVSYSVLRRGYNGAASGSASGAALPASTAPNSPASGAAMRSGSGYSLASRSGSPRRRYSRFGRRSNYRRARGGRSNYRRSRFTRSSRRRGATYRAYRYRSYRRR